MDNNTIINIPQAVATSTIDNWNKACEAIEGVPGGYGDHPPHESDVRSCEVRFITIQQRKLYQDIFNNIFPYVDYYESTFHVNMYRKLEIQHTTYNVGGHYTKHVDVNFTDAKVSRRKISLVLLLSDKTSYEGGELIISKKTFREDKGSLIMFRPTAIHSVERVTAGVRKSLVMWVHGPDWR